MEAGLRPSSSPILTVSALSPGHSGGDGRGPQLSCRVSVAGRWIPAVNEGFRNTLRVREGKLRLSRER